MASGSTRSTNRQPQTLKQAKAEFKKHGPRLSSQENRQLERSNELWRRAEKIKQNEKKRKETQKRKQEKEQREREARKRMGIARQKPSLSPHQVLIANFIARPRTESEEKVESQHEDGWDEGLDDDSLLELDALDAQDRVAENSPRIEKDGSRSQSGNIANLEGSGASEVPEDDWDVFLESGTQIQREINQVVKKDPTSTSLADLDSFFDIISTQDVTFSEADRKELGMPTIQSYPQHTRNKAAQDRILMPPPKIRPRSGFPQQSKPKTQTYRTWTKNIMIDDFLLADFDLSSQDFREIAG